MSVSNAEKLGVRLSHDDGIAVRLADGQQVRTVAHCVVQVQVGSLYL